MDLQARGAAVFDVMDLGESPVVNDQFGNGKIGLEGTGQGPATYKPLPNKRLYSALLAEMFHLPR
jgi:hypothetical protein